MTEEKFRVIQLTREFILIVDKELDNFPRKDIEIKTRLRNNCFDLLEILYKANIIENIEKKLENVTFEKRVVDYEEVMSDFLKKENITSYMLTTLIEKIEIDENKQVTIYYKFSPLNKLS